MILHLGEDTIVMKKDIVAILSIQSILGYGTQDFLRDAMEKGNVRMVGGEDYKSIVLAIKSGEPYVYYSPISSKTLKNRGL